MFTGHVRIGKKLRVENRGEANLVPEASLGYNLTYYYMIYIAWD